MGPSPSSGEGLGGPAKRLGPKGALLLLALALASFLPGFFTLPPFDRDEPRYTQATKQMVESGDYLDIRFQETPRHKKPIGVYWLQAGVIQASGLAEKAPLWVYRLVSLAGALAAVLGTGMLGARLFGAQAGVIAGAGLAACLLMGVEARLAKTDAALLACIVAAQAALCAAYLRSRAGREGSWAAALLFWAALGLGALIKGPVAPLLAVLTALALSLADRNARWLWSLKPLPGLLLAGLIVLPWFIAISLESGGAFLQESFGKDMLGKIFEGQESHGALPGYYLAVFWATSWPFGPAILLAFLLSWKERERPAIRFLLAWILPAWLLFELIMTKLPHYLLPVFPALFLLLGWSLTRRLDEALPVRRQRAFLALGQGLFALVSLLLLLGALVIGLEGEGALWIPVAMAGAALAGWAGFNPLALRQGVRRRQALLLGALLAYLGILQGLLPGLQSVWVAPRLAAAYEAVAACEGSRLASSGFREPSLVFLTASDTALLSPEEAARFLQEDPACRLAAIEGRKEAAFLEALGEGAEGLISHAVIEGFNYADGDEVVITLYGLTNEP